MTDALYRRIVLRASVALTTIGLAGCTTYGEGTTETSRKGTLNNGSKAKNEESPMNESLDYTVYPNEVPDIITTDLSSTADCDHGAAIATSEDEVEMFDWKKTAKDVKRFARESDFSEAILLAVRTISPGPIEYEIDKIIRLDDVTVKAYTTAKGVPGPSTPDVDTRLVRVHVGDLVPERAVIVRSTNDPEENTFEYATDDMKCPKS